MMEHLGVLKNSLNRVRSKSSWNLELLVFKERAGKLEYMFLEKTSQSKGENQQQTQTTYGIKIC